MSDIKLVGKFYDNHSLSIVNRNLAINMYKLLSNRVSIQAIDSPRPEYKVGNDTIKTLLSLESSKPAKIEVRHSYPIIWGWPDQDSTKVVYIQPWEFSSIPSEWQYKFDTFADAVITPSKWTADVYKNAGINPKKVFTIPNGYNPDIFFNSNSKPSIPTFLFVGCNQYRKGLDVLLRAWVAASKNTGAKLIIKDTPKIYGKTNLQQDIISLQYKTKCGSIIYDDSDKSEKEMAELYNSVNYIVHPYRGEGFGMHLQEAQACGAIPIVSSGGPTDEFITTGAKINTGRQIVNMYDIFALKPGDSMSNMGQHKWVLEPDVNHLATLLHNAIFNTLPVNNTTPPNNIWSEIAKQYINVLLPISDKNPERAR
jgi:glycosyltransferase involved in cell wall biosynthesis